MKNKFKAFSKGTLKLDYIISIVLILLFIFMSNANKQYSENLIDQYGVEVLSSTTLPYDTNGITTILVAWIAQLGISTGAYFVMAKSDHKAQIPMQLINEMPQEIKDKVDMTQVICSVLNMSE